MTYLHLAALGFDLLAMFMLGITVGVKVNGDRHDVGLLSAAFGCFLFVAAMVCLVI